MPEDETKPYLNASTYDKLQKVIRVGFPAFAALYLGLDGLWDLPAETQVVGTVALLATFLGVVLQISANRYADNPDGELVINENPQTGVRTPQLLLPLSPEELEEKDVIRFKVNKN